MTPFEDEEAAEMGPDADIMEQAAPIIIRHLESWVRVMSMMEHLAEDQSVEDVRWPIYHLIVEVMRQVILAAGIAPADWDAMAITINRELAMLAKLEMDA